MHLPQFHTCVSPFHGFVFAVLLVQVLKIGLREALGCLKTHGNKPNLDCSLSTSTGLRRADAGAMRMRAGIVAAPDGYALCRDYCDAGDERIG